MRKNNEIIIKGISIKCSKSKTLLAERQEWRLACKKPTTNPKSFCLVDPPKPR